MRVLIDATSLLLRSAGVKSYTYHWVKHLQKLATNDQVLAFPYLSHLPDLHHDRSIFRPAETYARLALLFFVNLPGNPAISWLSRRADIFHVSNQIRVTPRGPAITATVHDLTCWLVPELHTAGNIHADQSFANGIWKNAQGLIAVSENTRQDAIRILGIKPERIRTIHSGVPEAFFGATPAARSKPYVLFVGTIEPRKNVDVLLDAWHLLRRDVREQFDLIIAGPEGWAAERTVARLRSGIPGIEYLGYVPENELPGLTAGATAFVYPSLYEGFGFPVAQALAAGVPVITSNNSCLPEVAGDGAVYVDPRSATALANAIERVLTCPSLRDQLANAARAQAQQYRWEVCARRSLEFFHAVLC